jgi:hypothetical protein
MAVEFKKSFRNNQRCAFVAIMKWMIFAQAAGRAVRDVAARFRLDIPEPGCSESAQPVWFHCWTKPLMNK